jgi:hypothetical protein
MASTDLLESLICFQPSEVLQLSCTISALYNFVRNLYTKAK